MTIDHYTRVLLTVIATALVYLCVVLTPVTTLNAQGTKRPGELSGPGEVVVIGWRLPQDQRIPVQIGGSVPLQVTGDVKVVGPVQTEERRDNLLRVAVAGWEENGDPRRAGGFRPLQPGSPFDRTNGVPVTQIDRR